MDREAEEAEIKAIQAELEGLSTEQAEQTEKPDDTSDFFPEPSPEPEAEAEHEAEQVEEPAAEEPADETEQPDDDKPVPQKFVPQQALHAQREKNKEVTAENAELQRQLAEIKGQMTAFTEALGVRKQEVQPAPQQPAADPNAFVRPSQAELDRMQEEEPMKWVKAINDIAAHEQKQLIEAQGAQLAEMQNTVKETVSAYEQEQQTLRQQQENAQREQQFLGAIQENNAAMRQQAPDYDQVYTQYHQMRVQNEMHALGIDAATANERVHMMERNEAASALAQGMSPASYWYASGKNMLAMQPQAAPAAAPQAPAAPAPNGKPNPATIAKGMASGGGVASAASGGAGTSQSKTLAAIAEMSEDKLFELEQSGKLAELMGDWDG